jgi:lysophospholipase L1-like esterase
MPSVKKNIFLLCAASAVALVLAEIIVRLAVVQETKRLAMYDPELGWRGRPNGDGVYIRLEDSINVPFHYNSLGFRDKEIVPRESVATRILLLGDSFVENLEVPFEKTFPHLLEHHLQRDVDKGIDIVALASQGYSTAQEVLALRKFGDRLRPDVVLLVFFSGNDFEDNMRSNFAYLDGSKRVIFPPNSDGFLKEQWLRFQRWLYESSALVFYVKNVLASQTALKMEDASKAMLDESKEYSFEITRKLIAAARDEAEKYGARFGLLLVASHFQMIEHDVEKPDFVAGVCREAGIPFLDARSVVRPDDFFHHDIHFNEHGHAVMAAAIERFLADELGIGKSLPEAELPRKGNER